MARLKTFFTYALLVIGFMLLSDFLIFFAIKTTYVNFDKQIVSTSEDIFVAVDEAKKTYVHGYINGSYENRSNDTIDNKYLKYEFFSNKDNSLGARYIKVNNLKPNEKRKFEVKYNIQDTSYYKITEINGDEIGNIPEEEFSTNVEISFYHVLAAVILLYFL